MRSLHRVQRHLWPHEVPLGRGGIISTTGSKHLSTLRDDLVSDLTFPSLAHTDGNASSSSYCFFCVVSLIQYV